MERQLASPRGTRYGTSVTSVTLLCYVYYVHAYYVHYVRYYVCVSCLCPVHVRTLERRVYAPRTCVCYVRMSACLHAGGFAELCAALKS